MWKRIKEWCNKTFCFHNYTIVEANDEGIKTHVHYNGGFLLESVWKKYVITKACLKCGKEKQEVDMEFIEVDEF